MAFNILGAGMVTPVGYRAPSSCAAMRAAIDGLTETRFMFDGEWLRGGVVPLNGHPRGREKLLQMLVSAIDECLADAPGHEQDTALLVCLSKRDEPGRPVGLDGGFVDELKGRLVYGARIGLQVRLVEAGPMGAVDALEFADALLARREASYCLVAGVDSLLNADSLRHYHETRRLVTAENADGFFPGEAAAALLLGPALAKGRVLQCLGIGHGSEEATLDSERPLRSDGLVQAYRAAFEAAGLGYEHVDYRLIDASGEQYQFKDAALVLTRTMRVRKPQFDLWHCADSVGVVGTASVPLMLGVALFAAKKRYAPGPGVLCHFADDAGRRAAAIIRVHGEASHPSF